MNRTGKAIDAYGGIWTKQALSIGLRQACALAGVPVVDSQLRGTPPTVILDALDGVNLPLQMAYRDFDPTFSPWFST